MRALLATMPDVIGVARPGIRQELAAADLEFRRNNQGRLLERLFDVNVYFRTYRLQWRWTNMPNWSGCAVPGVRTLGRAPPDILLTSNSRISHSALIGSQITARAMYL